MGKSLKIQDMITTGVYTAIYFLLVGVATFISAFLLPGFSVILLPGFSALITGAVYLLLIKKTKKFGAITSMGIVMGLFFLLVGHFALTFIPHLVSAILADLVAKKGNYLSQKWNRLSFIVFSYGVTGPILPLWFFKSSYTASLVNRGKDAAYIAKTFANITWSSFFICIVFVAICGWIGGIIGQKTLEKHF
ncbi:MptD family putative ECF transporter S component [Vagococcus salmoninarum]|uniref:MptD family putative ECF transporter S component n=1 Tax=Vagococcus salmoninarum TaxID=2739 RepID=UPI0018813A4C|nr:MptD family putative ECF transporter S component [Vagococcus salmoninarum]MBE9390226.1 MptD family putative ECF transporter S component [Vagococcus salmoninarum]